MTDEEKYAFVKVWALGYPLGVHEARAKAKVWEALAEWMEEEAARDIEHERQMEAAYEGERGTE